MTIETLSWLTTVLVFGAIGWLIASRRRRPAGPIPFVALIVIAAVGYFYVGVDTIVFGVDQFKMFLNWIIVAGCVGGCLGLFLRNRQLRQADGLRA